MLCCPGCGSRFFKTLELRFELLKQQVQALLYKKRCKRCKEKILIEMTVVDGRPHYAQAQPGQWRAAERVEGNHDPFGIAARCPVASDYTRLISMDTASIFHQVLRREVGLGGDAPC